MSGDSRGENKNNCKFLRLVSEYSVTPDCILSRPRQWPGRLGTPRVVYLKSRCLTVLFQDRYDISKK